MTTQENIENETAQEETVVEDAESAEDVVLDAEVTVLDAEVNDEKTVD